MKRGHLLHSAIICRSDIHWHLIGVRILATVEPDIRLGPCAHRKTRTQAYFSRNSSVTSFMGGRIRFCDDAVNPAMVVDLHLNSGRGLMCALQARGLTYGSPSHYFGAGCRS